MSLPPINRCRPSSTAGPNPTTDSLVNVVKPTQGCFAAGTLIPMADGTAKPIERIAESDRVKSVSDAHPEGAISSGTVAEVFRHEPQSLMEVEVSGDVIRCTPNHPFYVRARGFIAAEELKSGDELRTGSGKWTAVGSISTHGDVQPVYNFRVAGLHTYFVRAGRSQALVNNKGGGEPVDSGSTIIGAGGLVFVIDPWTKAVLGVGDNFGDPSGPTLPTGLKDVSGDSSWGFRAVGGPSAQTLYTVYWNQTGTLGISLTIGHVVGSVVEEDSGIFGTTRKLESGSKIVLNADFGGGEITPQQLDLAIALANRFWGTLRRRNIQLSAQQYIRIVRVFLQMARDGAIDPAITRLGDVTFFEDALNRTEKKLRDWLVAHRELVRGLPRLQDFAVPRKTAFFQGIPGQKLRQGPAAYKIHCARDVTRRSSTSLYSPLLARPQASLSRRSKLIFT